MESDINEFWSNPENVRRFRMIESSIMRSVDSRLASGNALLREGRVTTEEDSIERRIEVGWPIYEIQ